MKIAKNLEKLGPLALPRIWPVSSPSTGWVYGLAHIFQTQEIVALRPIYGPKFLYLMGIYIGKHFEVLRIYFEDILYLQSYRFKRSKLFILKTMQVQHKLLVLQIHRPNIQSYSQCGSIYRGL